MQSLHGRCPKKYCKKKAKQIASIENINIIWLIFILSSII